MTSTNANANANANANTYWLASEPAKIGTKVRLVSETLKASKIEAQTKYVEWCREDDFAEIEVLLEQVGGDADGERFWLVFEVGRTEV